MRVAALALRHLSALLLRNEVYYSNRSAALLALQRHGDALADGRKCVELRPGWAKGFARMGAAFSALERFTEVLFCRFHHLAAGSSVQFVVHRTVMVIIASNCQPVKPSKQPTKQSTGPDNSLHAYPGKGSISQSTGPGAGRCTAAGEQHSCCDVSAYRRVSASLVIQFKAVLLQVIKPPLWSRT
jgi:hypothetical protein